MKSETGGVKSETGKVKSSFRSLCSLINFGAIAPVMVFSLFTSHFSLLQKYELCLTSLLKLFTKKFVHVIIMLKAKNIIANVHNIKKEKLRWLDKLH